MSIYIHQNPNNADLSSIANNFKKDIIAAQQRKIAQGKKKQLEDLLENNDEAKARLEEILKTVQEAAKQTVSDLNTVGFKGIIDRKGKIKSSISPEQVQERLNTEAESLEKYAKILNTFIEQIDEKTIFSELDVNNLIKTKKQIEDAIEKLRGEKYEEALGQIVGVASNAIGSLSEYNMAMLLDIMGIKVELTGTQAGQSYKAKTSDLRLEFVGVDENKLGISMKRTRQASNAKSVLAKVKTTTLLSLIQASQIDMDLNGLYNIIANHGRTQIFEFDESSGQGRPIPSTSYFYPGWGELVKNLHYAFALTSLAGDLDGSDFATYLVINDNIYDILDIIFRFFNNEKVLSISSTINSSQAEIARKHQALVENSINSENYAIASQERSASMVNAINHMSIVVHARVSLNASMEI